MTSFRLVGLPQGQFEHLFELSDQQLLQMSAIRQVATSGFGFPCRVSLEDAQVGETLLLLPFTHQPAASPYQASGPIFVRRGVKQQVLDIGVVPTYVTLRLMSLRAYDAANMMVDATVCEGPLVAERLEQLFLNADIAYVHLHNAKRGCYSCLAQRA